MKEVEQPQRNSGAVTRISVIGVCGRSDEYEKRIESTRKEEACCRKYLIKVKIGCGHGLEMLAKKQPVLTVISLNSKYGPVFECKLPVIGSVVGCTMGPGRCSFAVA